MNAPATTSIAAHKTNNFKWLLKREFWENRGGFLWAPVITGAIVSFLYLLMAIIGSIAGR
ncbi:MAG: ABC transporter permease, partial [Pseudoxanthomonas sp.]